MMSQTSEEDAAKQQQSQRLPERNLAPAEEGRGEPVPEMHDDFAEQHREHYDSDRGDNKDPFLFHIALLTIS
jgi:hypothetical protein